MLVKLIKTIGGKAIEILAEKDWIQELLKDGRVKLAIEELKSEKEESSESEEKPKRKK